MLQDSMESGAQNNLPRAVGNRADKCFHEKRLEDRIR
jgi:hypothetical protein